jgi:hypothetical protein
MPHSVRGGPSSAERARWGKTPLALMGAGGLENEIATIVTFHHWCVESLNTFLDSINETEGGTRS